MLTFKKLKFLNHLILLLLTLNFFFTLCLSQHTSTTFCGKIPIQSPFLISNSTVSSSLNNLLICKFHKLYFRTFRGFFGVSSINYTTKTLTISHPSCCSSSTAHLKACTVSSTQNQELEIHFSCLLVNDPAKVDKGFHPKDLNCSHYSLLYKSSANEDEYELGTRISSGIPDHVPDLCKECKKPNGNCGVGLKCICHPKECKNKVISMAGFVKPIGNNLYFSMLSSIVALVSFMDFLYKKLKFDAYFKYS